MKLKINLYGETFRHNLVDGVISSTVNKKPSFIEYVEDGTGSINLFVDFFPLIQKFLLADLSQLLISCIILNNGGSVNILSLIICTSSTK